MSNTIVEKVKDFLVRLVKDESFRAQLTNKKIEEVRKVMADSGYTFSQNEFEKAAIKIIEFKELGEFHDLTEEELVGAVGGVSTKFDWDLKFNFDFDQDITDFPDIDITGVYPGGEAIAMYGVILPPDAELKVSVEYSFNLDAVD
ncbi:MAG: Nif11-like leader peptide family natural product precursor [Calothrix sp. MO_167.B12]|nr:Nif11-like leader peptide family natural product precursor [Calothrix sp. MO_167.B12]